MTYDRFWQNIETWLAADDEPDADGDAMRAELEPDLVPATDPAAPFMRTEPWLS